MWVPGSRAAVSLVPTVRQNLHNYFPARAATQGRPYKHHDSVKMIGHNNVLVRFNRRKFGQ